MEDRLIPAVDVDSLWEFEAPEGAYPANVDKAGRLKWPVEFERFLSRFPGKQFFASTINREIGFLYDIAGWRKVKAKLEKPDEEEQYEASERALHTAMTFGERVELDDQGRTTLPVELRRALDLEGKKVQVWVRKNSIQIQNYDRRAARDLEISAKAAEDDALLRRKQVI